MKHTLAGIWQSDDGLKTCFLPSYQVPWNKLHSYLNILSSGDNNTHRIRKQRTATATVWLIRVDSLWCVFIKACTKAERCGLLKAHQRVAYFISQVEIVLRKGGRGNSEEVSESNKAIVPVADPNTRITVVAATHNKSPNRRSGVLN